MLGPNLKTTACTVNAYLFFSSKFCNCKCWDCLSSWQNYSSPQKKKEEKSEPSDKDDEGKEEVGAESQGDESSGDSSKPVPAKEEEVEETPAKKPRINPYGVWEQIQEEEDP